ncbi:MAG: NAD-dependent epimerase/dehydratase family protein [Caldilineaceae bacterium]
MRYFITGATGFVGGKVAEKLCAQGHEVIALVRNPAKAQALTSLGVELTPGDITDPASMRTPMRGVDGVYHIAGWYKIGTRDKANGIRINVEGTRNVLTLMQELAIPKGVYTSTLAVNSDTHGQEVDEHYHFTGRHLSVYDETKWRAHYEVANPLITQGLPLVIVQPGLIYGPGDQGPSRDAFAQYLQRTLPMLPQQTAYSWAHVDDVADAHIAAMDKGSAGASYIICGPSHTLIEGMQIAEQITGIKAPALTAPPWLLRGMSGLMGVVERVIPLPATYTSEFLRVSAGVTYLGNNAKARTELGYQPRDLATGLCETLPLLMQELGIK